MPAIARRLHALGRPGDDLLSHALRRSTIGAEGLHGRVRNGIGCFPLAITTRSTKRANRRPDHVLRHGFAYIFSYFQCLRGRSGGGLAATHDVAIKPIELLVPVSFTHYCASTPGLSTWWSSTALIGSSGIEGGFPLRCFQRLSCPNIATRRCSWRNNRYTRGSFTPVLSY